MSCPACGANTVAIRETREHAIVTFGEAVAYQGSRQTCLRCHEETDVTDTAVIEAAYAEAETSATTEMLRYIDTLDSQLDRELRLPQGTVRRWRDEGAHGAEFVLLQVVTAFPWMRGVIDSDFADGAVAEVLADPCRWELYR